MRCLTAMLTLLNRHALHDLLTCWTSAALPISPTASQLLIVPVHLTGHKAQLGACLTLCLTVPQLVSSDSLQSSFDAHY